jgi:Leucine-rich repeat (LRR) protein
MPPVVAGAVSAVELFKTYRANVALASEKYADRQIVVTGRVLRIADGQRVWNSKYDWGRTYRVEMWSGEEQSKSYLSFQFFVLDKIASPLAKLKVDEVATIEGECKGWLPKESRPDNRECIYFWDGKVVEPNIAAEVANTKAVGIEKDSPRLLAEWVISAGGTVRVKYGAPNGIVEPWVGPNEPYPTAWFVVTGVNLNGCKQVRDSDLARCRGPGTVLTALQLEYTQVTDAGLAQVAQMQRLTEVSLCHSAIGDGAIPLLAKLPDLTTLYLSNTKLSEAGLKRLDELGKVAILALRDLPVTDNVMPHLAELSCLVNLDLTGAKITDAGLVHLAKLKLLQVLDLNKTALTDGGLKNFAGLQLLFRLKLDGTQIKGDGLRALAELPKLQDLSLADTPLTDAAVELLAGMKELRHLSVRNTQLTPSGIARLRRALPQCKVVNE